MSSNDRNDIKSALRKREFPFCARDALAKAEELLCLSASLNRQQLLKQSELISEIISEFVFCESERRNIRKKVTRIQELELMQIIHDYMLFDGITTNRSSLNSLYVLLFPIQAMERRRLAINLVSFSVSTRNAPLLNATAVLLQQHGYSSPFSGEFVKKIVVELFLLISVDAPAVMDLPRIAPMFTASFITRLVETYKYSEGKCKSALPPTNLLEIVLSWLEGNARLCVIPIISNSQPSVLHGTTLLPPITPHIGLIRWCIWSHLEDSPHSKLYAALEQSILESLAVCRSTGGLLHNNVILTQDIISILGPIGSCSFSDRQKKAIESLVKIIRVALITNTLSGSKQDLRRHLQGLPYNEALDILVEDIAIVP